MRLTKSKVTATISLSGIAPGVAFRLHAGAIESLNSRLIRNGSGVRTGRTLQRSAVSDDGGWASEIARLGLHRPMKRRATLISLFGVFPFTSAVLGFISALAATQLAVSCSRCMQSARPAITQWADSSGCSRPCVVFWRPAYRTSRPWPSSIGGARTDFVPCGNVLDACQRCSACLTNQRRGGASSMRPRNLT
jgi:hypothetical protein